ncbi:CHASE2 domain-containing protein [Chitinimonas sp. BJB300]|uniref:CHASE2 domain-containing protein n=1 Tax=Chitinimonas sp. BJB300 TaxID=1559339 RepID=UPI000C115C15|nr:adenylate/guanylate cyclase domain-containing protein [Chitinimonas sp. BJB300]PHV10375.1 adenylate/guanylate cyclase domain-containing protein [Chitinimonas sp. BJB300]TSJ87685.1 adenylate/guanylate cyclase domain-containing protein [Chitinimonas sp. BJB300]
MKTLRRYWLQLLLSTLVLGFFLGYADQLWRPRVIEQIDLWLYDARLVKTMPGGVDPRVVVVDLDEKSLAEMGRWPWPRNLVAQLLDKLTQDYKVAAVGFDIVFAEKDDSSGLPVLKQLAGTTFKDDPAFQSKFEGLAKQLDYDARLADSLYERAVVLGYYFSFEANANRSGVLPKPVLPAGIFKGRSVSAIEAPGYGANLPVLMSRASASGHFNPLTDIDGVTRRVAMLVEHEGRYYESLSLAMVRTYLNFPQIEPIYGASPLKSYQPLEWLKVGPLTVPVDEHVRALVPYRGNARSFTYLSASDVLKGRVNREILAGRMVLIGTTAPGLLDLRVAPVDAVYPGVEVHANMIAGMMDNSLPAQPDYLRAAEILLIFICGVVLLLALLRLSPLAGTLVTVALLVVVTAGNFILWQRGHLALPLASTLLSILLLYAISMACGYFFESRNKKQMASLFGQYVPPELVAKMSEQPEKYSMEGQSRELTVLFSDVRGFTTISESMDPKELTRFMNEFLTSLSEVIRTQYLGTIDKYMGDCVMAFWGAPIHDPDHARNAVLAGLAMQRAIRDLGPSLRDRGWPPIEIGIGINTGRMTVGDMGSQIRKAYTVMGDAVNLASRLESITKRYGVGMLVGESTRAVAGETVVFRELDRVRVKGKDEPVTIYEPLGLASEVDKALIGEIQLFHQVLKLYRSQNWDMAELQLLNLQKQRPDSVVYALYLSRIAHFRQFVPPPDWDGVYEFDSK